jgi:hypothetical protein
MKCSRQRIEDLVLLLSCDLPDGVGALVFTLPLSACCFVVVLLFSSFAGLLDIVCTVHWFCFFVCTAVPILGF